MYVHDNFVKFVLYSSDTGDVNVDRCPPKEGTEEQKLETWTSSESSSGSRLNTSSALAHVPKQRDFSTAGKFPALTFFFFAIYYSARL